VEKSRRNGKILDAYHLPTLIQKDINELNIYEQWEWHSNKELPKNLELGIDVFTAEFYQSFEELTSILPKSFHKIENYQIHSAKPVLLTP
jgi:hypothetical protein